jgi:hypothetical protein
MLKLLLEKARNMLFLCFKKCSMCTQAWRSRDDFLSDSNLTVKGYTANLDHLELGIFFFDHNLCKTTLAIQASEFTDLYKGQVFDTRLTGTEECPRYCLNKNELGICPAKCECAYVREVLNIVSNWENKSSFA